MDAAFCQRAVFRLLQGQPTPVPDLPSGSAGSAVATSCACLTARPRRPSMGHRNVSAAAP
jgi:hypothetical protein